MTLLNVVLFLPLAAFAVMLLLPKTATRLLRQFTLVATLATFVLSLGLAVPFYQTGPGVYFDTNVDWIQSPSIGYHVHLDGLSLWLVILSTLLSPICVLVSWSHIQDRVNEFHAFLLLLEFGVVGVFVAVDLFLFYVFWEVTLVPMYFLIGIWGHERRIYAAVKFFLYTMAGSVLMLGAIIYLYGRAGTFDAEVILSLLASGRLTLSGAEQLPLFLAFFVAFAIKVPLFPLHTWLPDAHVEAPTAGSVMLASVLLKLGTYGIVRYCLPLFPSASRDCADWIVVLAIVGIIYGALVAMVQPNMKKLVAYSSVSHLGFVVLGIFSFTQQGMDGAVYQMLNHGISTGALFMLVGMMYERRHSLEISAYGGAANVAPKLSVVFMVTALASMGLPLLNNFVGEFLVLQGAAIVSLRWALFGAVGVILSACYMLWLYQRTFTGSASEDVRHHLTDLNRREMAAMAPLLLLMVWMGVGPNLFLKPITAASATILEQTKVNVEFQVSNPPGLLARAQEVMPQSRGPLADAHGSVTPSMHGAFFRAATIREAGHAR